MSFRLEGLLRVRKNQENQVQRVLAEINTQLVSHRKTMQQLEASRRRNRESLNQRYAEPVDASTLSLYDNFFNGADRDEQARQQAIEEVSGRMESKRQELVKAMKKRRTLEFLKEQQQHRDSAEARKRETAFLDEVATAQWHRREP
jgi:flagellar FliJ protein